MPVRAAGSDGGIDVFRRGGRSFLMPPHGVELQPETIIDISHESLIRNWGRLQDWVKDEAESARIYRRLAGAATDYRGGVGGLLDDVTLQYVLRWRERSEPDHAWGVRYHPEFDEAMAYLDESRLANEARIASERERDRRELETAQAFAEQQARSVARMRRLAVALFAIMLLAFATSAYAFRARAKAKGAELAAQAAERDLKVLAVRLQAEKSQTEALAKDSIVRTKMSWRLSRRRELRKSCKSKRLSPSNRKQHGPTSKRELLPRTERRHDCSKAG